VAEQGRPDVAARRSGWRAALEADLHTTVAAFNTAPMDRCGFRPNTSRSLWSRLDHPWPIREREVKMAFWHEKKLFTVDVVFCWCIAGLSVGSLFVM
jgi:hypothetical protein